LRKFGENKKAVQKAKNQVSSRQKMPSVQRAYFGFEKTVSLVL
jgi:hypothetical protein